jgi:hypothetical protein
LTSVVVSAGGHGVVSHAGSRLLADLSDATGLASAFTDALRQLRPRGTGHDPGRIAIDLAVMLADGGEAIADLALLRDQAEVFGPVASTATAWRLLAGIAPSALARLRPARATAREVARLQAAETKAGIPAARAGGHDLPGLVLYLDATLVTCHSEKEQAAATYKRGFGYHPLLCFLDNTGQALAAVLRPGATPAPTPPPTTSPSSTKHLPRSPTPTATAHRSSSARTVPEEPQRSCTTHPTLHTRGILTYFSVDTPSPSRSATRSEPCPSRSGIPHPNRTAPCARARKSPS